MSTKGNVYLKWLRYFALFWLTGCAVGPQALRWESLDYATAYGDLSNRQLLLNLARLANDDPVYFIQLGSISSQYQLQTMLGFSSSGVMNSPGFYKSTQPGSGPTSPTSIGIGEYIKHMLTLGGSANASLTQTPVIGYVPLTGTNFVQATLAPISDKVYLTFYDQDYPADLIVRTMMSQVEWKHIDYTSTPIGTNYEFLVNNPHDPSYGRFLEFCANLHNAQLFHMLTVEPVAKQAESITVSSPKLPDVVAAVQANLSVKSDNNGKTTVSKPEKTPQFVLNSSTNLMESISFVENSEVGVDFSNVIGLFDPQGGTNLMEALSFVEDSEVGGDFSNFIGLLDAQTRTNVTVKSHPQMEDAFTYDLRPRDVKIAKALEVASNIINLNITLKTRTFESAMHCVAKQEAYFKEMISHHEFNNITYQNDIFGLPYAVVNPRGPYPMRVRPAMILTYDDCKYCPDSVLANITYNGASYVAGGWKSGWGKNQNQTVFTMLSYLFAQTAISTQNLPVQQLIQVQ